MLPVRVRHAIRLFADHIENPIQIGDVASAGYASSSPMVRHYLAEFGVDPAQDRRQINAFRTSGAVSLN